MANTLGHLYRLTTFGESHGKALGGIIDGCPSGIALDEDFIQQRLNLRKPGTSLLNSKRKEEDKVEILSGVFNGKTLGTPIGFIIRNRDARSPDYEHLKDVYRPSHGDFTYQKKYGIRDYRGGGRASARETANWVVGGAVAEQVLKPFGINIVAFVSRIGEVQMPDEMLTPDREQVYANEVRCPGESVARQMSAYLQKIKARGDTVGGIIHCVIRNLPAGLGEPVFDKMQALLAKAMMSLNAVKGIEFGSGFAAAETLGSQHNDQWEYANGKIVTSTNHSGGIQAGITNGMDIHFRLAFKPVATLMQGTTVINENGEKSFVKGKGRHDVCPVPRAVPVVEALSAMVVLDTLLLHNAYKGF